MKKTMNISIKREQNNARISSAEREKFGAKLNSKILSPLRRDGYKAGMIMMLIALSTMLLTTACSSEDDLVNNTANTENTINKGYALPVTVNVTRQGDATTRATYNESTKKLEFSAYDKLFVYGNHYPVGNFAGTLDYDAVSGKFSGTIYTESPYEGTAEELFTTAIEVTATLLPNGYDANSFLSINNNSTTDIAYDDRLTVAFSDAFVASETAKATGVEQLSWEQASTYSSGFTLSPGNAILNFTISGLAAGAQDVSLQIDNGIVYTVTGSVTPNAGVATFAIGVPVGANISSEENNLTVGSSNLTLPGGTALAAGKIYNITRNAIPGALIGVFSVGDTKKVYFSKGNLQYTKSTGKWSFMDHQYSTVETINQNVGDNYASQDVVSLFGWGTSGKTFASGYGTAYQPYATSNTSTAYGPTGTYNLTDTYANGDWGVNMGSGWRTLTIDEWAYLFNTRTVNGGTGSGKSYTLGQSVNGKLGVVIYPDNYTGAVYSGSNWSTFESAGCVFLPAAGYRDKEYYESDVVDWVDEVGERGYYWSSSANSDDEEEAHYVYFISDELEVDDYDTNRYCGHSVRLVRDVAAPAPSYTMAAAATAEDKGKLICTDGHIHAYNTDAECTATRVAMIVYVGNGSDCTNGLAIQLNASPESKDWNDAKTYASGLTAVPGGTWRLPSKADWQNMFVGCAKSGDADASESMDPIAGFKEKIGATGITWQSGGFWSSTGSGSYAWYVNVNLNNSNARANFSVGDTTYPYRVLGCLAF